MNTAEPLLIEPEVRHVGAKLLLAMLGVLWILLLLTGLRSDTNIAPDADALLFISCLYLLVLCWRVANTLAEAAQVLGQRRAPAQLWHAWSTLAMREPTRAWAMLCAAATVTALLPASAHHWPAAAALLSLTLSIGMIKSLARHGFLPRACSIAIDIGVVLLALAITLLASPLVAFDRFASLPAWLLLMCASSWPLLNAWLMRLWRDEPQRYRCSGRSRQRYKPIAALFGTMRRYSSLRWGEDAQIKQLGIEAARKYQVLQIFSGMPVIYMALLMWSPMRWNQQLSAGHLLTVGFFCVFMSANMLVRDRHWRMLLVPGGLHRGRIGLHIFISTLEINLSCAAIVATVVLMAVAVTGRSVPAMLDLYVSHSAAILEIVFAASVGLLVRALPKAVWFTVLAFVSLCFLAASFRLSVVLAMLNGRLSNGSHMTAGPGYVCILALASIVFVALGNRMWTPKKLFPSGVQV